MVLQKQGKSYGNPPKSEREHIVLNLNDEVKILHLLKGGMSLAEVQWCYGKNELSICSIQDKEYGIRPSFC
jgi:hypothetical protein